MHSSARLRKITLLVGSTLTVMAGAIISPALPEISREYAHLPDPELMSKLILTLPALVIALLAPLAGIIIDRTGRKRVLLFSLLLYALAGSTGAYLNNIYLILTGRVFLGMAVGGLMTAIVTLIGDYYEGDHRSRVMGYQAAFASMGGLVFITSGGILADVHWRYPFLIYTASLVVLVFAWIYIYEPPKAKPARGYPLKGIKLLKSIPRKVGWVYLISFFSMSVFYMVPVQMPFMLSNLEGVSNTQVGFAIAFMNITAITSSFNYSRLKKRMDFSTIQGIVYILIAIGYFIISQSGTYYMMIAGILISVLGFGMLWANINLWLISIAPSDIRGTLVGYLNSAIFLGMFLSPVLLQPLVYFTSLYQSFMLVSFLLLALSAIFLFMKKKKLRG